MSSSFVVYKKCEVCGTEITFLSKIIEHKGFHVCSDECTATLDDLIGAKDAHEAVHLWMAEIYKSSSGETKSAAHRHERALNKIKFYLSKLATENPALIDMLKQSKIELTSSARTAGALQN